MHDKIGIRWVRVIITGVLTEAVIIILIVATATIYKYALSPTEAEYQTFAGRVGYYLGVFGGAPTAFALALWACRPLRADFLKNGLLVGCVAALLHAGLFVASGAGLQVAYVIADALKLAGGTLGGYVVGRSYGRSRGSVGAGRAA